MKKQEQNRETIMIDCSTQLSITKWNDQLFNIASVFPATEKKNAAPATWIKIASI